MLKNGHAREKSLSSLSNYSGHEGELSLYDISGDNAADALPKADFMTEMDGQFTKVWKVDLSSRMLWRVSYSGKGGGLLEIRGIEDNKKMVVDLDV